jgi:hypothetical protein
MDSKWEQVLISWMSGKSVEYQLVPDGTTEVIPRADFQIVELENLLLAQGLIPQFLCGNNELYVVLLLRMQLQLIYSVTVPQRIEGRVFTGLLNSRRLLRGENQTRLARATRELEHKTGINLACYWKIAENEKANQVTKGILFHKKIFTKFVPTPRPVQGGFLKHSNVVYHA